MRRLTADLASWIKVLKNDERAIFAAASHAQRADDYLNGAQARDIINVDGHAFSWRRLCELRRQQIEAWRAAEPSQPALFELHRDCQPRVERTAAGRFREPSLLEHLVES